MSAGARPSEEAMLIRGKFLSCNVHTSKLCNVENDGRVTDCHCDRSKRLDKAALAIDAAIQRAVEAERERCRRAVCKYCAEGNEPRPARDYDQPMHLFQGYPPRVCAAAALRATPNTGG